ncbi:hypothetical protein ACWG8W_06125 [Citricoccus zhacaiensis]
MTTTIETVKRETDPEVLAITARSIVGNDRHLEMTRRELGTDYAILCAIVGNPVATPETLDLAYMVVDDMDEQLTLPLASHANTPSWVLEGLSDSIYASTRAACANNPRYRLTVG